MTSGPDTGSPGAPDDPDGRVGAALRRAADRHRPDRERMLARVEEAMEGRIDGPADGRSAAGADELDRRRSPASAARPPRRPLLIAATAFGLVAAVTLGWVGVRSLDSDDGRQTVTVATNPPMDNPSPCACDQTAVPSPPPSGPRPSGSPTSVSPSSGYLWSDGSIDPGSSTYWSQSDLTLRTGRDLTGLSIELRVAYQPGVASTGWWSTLPEWEFTATVTREGGELVYRWVLRAGSTVPAGRYVFAAQYDHKHGKRDAGGDRYTVTGSGPGGPVRVAGDFSPGSAR